MKLIYNATVKHLDTTIRFALQKDTKRIMAFLSENWIPYINLSDDSQYFHFYFDDPLNVDALNFAIAEDNHGKLVGVCGFIRSSLSENSAVWLSVWKTIKNAGLNVGIQIINFIMKHTGASCICANNVSMEGILSYKLMGMYTGKLHHYYRIADLREYRLIEVNNKKILPIQKSKYKLVRLKNIDEVKSNFSFTEYNDINPIKDYWYINRRYFGFPRFSYEVYGISTPGNKVESLIVMRLIEVNGARALRIVDFLGDETNLSLIGYELNALMYERGCEFIEFYCFGLAPSTLMPAGFIEQDADDTNIISSYLEPFQKINRDYYFFSNTMENFRMFRADGEQDRYMGNV